MNHGAIPLAIIMIAGILIAGCTQLSGSGTAAPAVPATPVNPSASPAAAPQATGTTGPAAAGTGIVQENASIIRYISQVRDIRDSKLLFSLRVPVEWNVTTYRMENPENFEGSMYQTDLLPNNTFYIQTFTDYRSREQNYRDECRRWVPAPKESVVTINGITFDRFESAADGVTRVAYVARKTSVNDFGYLSVLAFSANTSNRFAAEDYETVVASFRYPGREEIGSLPGDEIPRITPPAGEGGSVRSAFRSGGSAPSGGRSTGGCARCR